MGRDNRMSRMTAATPAIAVTVRRESVTAEVTQLSGLPLVRGSLAEGTRLPLCAGAVSDDRRGWASRG
jgi:hypothetical protein